MTDHDKFMTMQKSGALQGYYHRFPILSWLGIIFCFVLFPAGLLNLGLNHLFEVMSANNREQIAGRMETALKTVELFSDNEYFAHHLLLQMNQQAMNSPDPKAALGQLKTRLQKRYPGAFTFICWDEKGDLIKEISDETSFGYIIKKTWQFLKKASDLLGRWDETYEKVNLGTLADVEKESKILRNFLGKLLVSYQLRYPWLSGQLGRPLQTAPPGARSRIWYRINDSFGFLCFINDEFIRSRYGSEFAINKIRREMPEFSVHVSDYPASEEFFPPADSIRASRMVLALSRFEAMSPAAFEIFDDMLVGCRLVNQNQRAVCWCPADLLFSSEKARLEYLGWLARLLLPLFFVFLVWFKTRNTGFVSIRFKLVVIFCYAGGIPLLIMGSVGVEYLDQKKLQLVYEAQTRGINLLYGIDRNFQIFLNDQASYLADLVKNYNDKYAGKVLDSAVLNIIREKLLAEYRPESIQIYNEKGLGLVADSHRTIFSDYTLPSQIAVEVLHSAKSGGESGKESFISGSFGMDELSKKREISNFGLGTHELYLFFDFLGRFGIDANQAMLQLFWRREKLQRNYFERFHAENIAGKIPEGAEVAAYYPVEDLIFSAQSQNDNLRSLCQSAYTSLILRKNAMPLKTGEYSAVAIRGMNLDRICLLFLTPMARIENAIALMRLQMLALAVVFLLMTVMMFRFLANRFLTPIGEINNAIRAIGERNFSYRLAIDSSREFRELATTFNATLETLHDLETARIVQENLLPERETALGTLRLVARSQAFSRIGGDYFDFFPISENTLGVFIGDVSGHGISAALIMAMAKATLISVKNSFSDGEKLLDALDQMLAVNRTRGSREYMTGLFITVDSDTGRCRLINRGHCMPILVGVGASHVEHVKSGGLPLGYNRPGSNKAVEFCLAPDETLCLYTDGIAEACAGNGDVLGYDGFGQMLQTSWHAQPETFLETLLQNHSRWATKRDDDQSVVLIRRCVAC